MNRTLTMPNEAACPRCSYFDPTHPEVVEILGTASESQRRMAPCKCIPQFRYDQPAMLTYGPNVKRVGDQWVDMTTGEVVAGR